jgi:uncharacterized protein with PQ loop repeat
LLAGWVVLGIAFSVGARPLGITASIATISGVLPQVVALVLARRRAVSGTAGLSRSRWAMSFACNGLWVAYGVIAGDPVVMVNSSIIGLLSVAIVLLAAAPAIPAAVAFEPEYAVAA